MTSVRRTYGLDSVGPERLTPSLRRGRYCRDKFMDPPICWDAEAATADGAPGGTTGRANAVWTGRHTFQYYILGAGQTIVAPTLATDGGYDFGLDQTAAEGVEINFGSLKADHPRVFRLGSSSITGDDDFYARLYFSVEDVSGVDLWFGFRGGASIQGVQTALATYTDLFGLRVLGDSSSAAGAITVAQNLNDATDITETTLTDTLADGTAVEFEVQVRARKAYSFINGVPKRETNFTFDAGDYLTSTAYILHTTDVAGQIKILGFECGFLEDRPQSLLSVVRG